MAARSAIQSSVQKQKNEIFEKMNYMHALKYAAEEGYLVCCSFYQWHDIPHVIVENLPPAVAEILCSLFGDSAEMEGNTVKISGPLTKDDEGA